MSAGEYSCDFEAQGFRWELSRLVRVPLQAADVARLPDRLSVSCAASPGFQLRCCVPGTHLGYTASWSPREGSEGMGGGPGEGAGGRGPGGRRGAAGLLSAAGSPARGFWHWCLPAQQSQFRHMSVQHFLQNASICTLRSAPHNTLCEVPLTTVPFYN